MGENHIAADTSISVNDEIEVEDTSSGRNISITEPFNPNSKNKYSSLFHRIFGRPFRE